MCNIKRTLQSSHIPRPPNRFEIPNQIVFNSPEEYYQTIYHQVLALACDTLRCRITNKYMPVLEKIEHLLADSWKAVAINQENLEFACNYYDSLIPRRLEAQLL